MIQRCARLGLALLAGLSLLLTGCSGGGTDPTTGAATSTATTTGAATGTAPTTGAPAATRTGTAAPSRTATATSGLPTVREADLPPEARRTLALIERGGPFPYAKDGSVFANFERVLPPHRRGYYHEYTVRTPGEHDRGARRIVTGQRGETYYTDDHYQSFREVVADETR
ncbi:ribonuclease domain-containing protein [Streptomyces sp. NPDC053493]|uniref:ribonuclease domain-containing protein n=1 Tax=Streptomyces sp. NPDC053493 TaxID=3365705 RepID=UPI0037D9282A